MKKLIHVGLAVIMVVALAATGWMSGRTVDVKAADEENVTFTNDGLRKAVNKCLEKPADNQTFTQKELFSITDITIYSDVTKLDEIDKIPNLREPYCICEYNRYSTFKGALQVLRNFQ